MRIGIDCRAVRSFTDGIGKYSLRLIEGLSAIDRENQYVLLVRRDYTGKRDWGKNFKTIEFGYNHLSMQTLFSMGRVVNRLNLDLFHSPFFLLPYGLHCRTVITVPDLMALRVRGFFSGRPWPLEKMAFLFHQLFVPTTIRRADAIAVISNATADEVRQVVGVRGKPIYAIHLGVDPGFKPQPAEMIQEARKKYNLPAEYFLYIGNCKPYKNLTSLLNGFFLYRQQRGSVSLVIASYRDRFRPIVDQQIRSLGIEKEIMIIDAVCNDDLPRILSGAIAFYFPSIAEGFGLPPLEAMACGCPTAVAAIPALLEVVGDAGLHFDPRHPAEISETMSSLSGNKVLRQQLSEKGIQRARQFTWESFSRKYLDLYLTTG
jgi:glycosyltransferase involved in cell wall biosynthesis